MPASRLIGVALVSVLLGQTPSGPRLGSALSPGMQLLYESGGVTTPWFIDSVNTSFEVDGRSDCLRLVLRIGTGASQVRVHCAVGDTMMNWNANTGRLVPARRLGMGLLKIPTGNRGLVQYAVLNPTTATLGDQQLAVLPTTITTFDSTARAIRRLTERFAPEFATAIDGVFEVPDSANTGQWRVTQQFRLTAIRRP